jgi:hypothetical protein
MQLLLLQKHNNKKHKLKQPIRKKKRKPLLNFLQLNNKKNLLHNKNNKLNLELNKPP